MLTLRPLGSVAQPQSPRGIHLDGKCHEYDSRYKVGASYRTAVLAAVSEGYWPNTKNKIIDMGQT